MHSQLPRVPQYDSSMAGHIILLYLLMKQLYHSISLLYAVICVTDISIQGFFTIIYKIKRRKANSLAPLFKNGSCY